MSNPIASAAKGAPSTAGITPNDARLRKTAVQLEGLFVQRLFAAMRDTVDQDGLFSGGSAEATFTSLLDEKMSQRVPEQWHGEHSLAQALYNQLRKRVTTEEMNAGVPPNAAVSTDTPNATPQP